MNHAADCYVSPTLTLQMDTTVEGGLTASGTLEGSGLNVGDGDVVGHVFKSAQACRWVT